MTVRSLVPALFWALTGTLFGAGLTAPAPAAAQGLAGAYLAARHATIYSDFKAASDYYARAIIADPANPALLESAAMSYMALGDVERAATVARRLASLEVTSQIANMALVAVDLKRENFQDVLDEMEAGRSIGEAMDPLVRAWAQIGAGRMSSALDAFDELAASDGMEMFGLYHKALALATVGDFEGAAAILSGEAGGPLNLTRRGIIAYVQVLSQLERNGDALELIEKGFGDDLDPALEAIRADLEAGRVVPFTAVRGAKDGAAEVFLVVAGALAGETADGYTLLYSRVAEYLRPDLVDAILMSANLLEELERYELATLAYNSIPRDHPAFAAAELGRAEALRQSGRTEAAIEVMEQLTRLEPDNPSVFITLGDTLRQLERYDAASRAYDAALALFDDPQRAQWILYFARGITHEREDRWTQAESDFRTALELNPGQPQVLNYLGYSYVEMGENYDEALEMIEQAVAAQPNSGYIVDSLGWAQFRLGEYAEAVVNLERAAELMAVDPVVNDHLGDAYWAVGRQVEARFQWKRALSFDPEEDEAERIRRKLELGLDAVLEAEGEQPIRVTTTDG